MEDKKPGFFTEAQDHLESYVEDRLLLLKLQATEKSARLIAIMATVFLLALLSFFVLLFVSIMLGFFFGSKTGSLFAGFAIVTGIYAVLLVILIAVRKKYLEKFIADTVVKVLFDKTGNADEDED